jgi:hypothetical protein
VAVVECHLAARGAACSRGRHLLAHQNQAPESASAFMVTCHIGVLAYTDVEIVFHRRQLEADVHAEGFAGTYATALIVALARVIDGGFETRGCH